MRPRSRKPSSAGRPMRRHREPNRSARLRPPRRVVPERTPPMKGRSLTAATVTATATAGSPTTTVKDLPADRRRPLFRRRTRPLPPDRPTGRPTAPRAPVRDLSDANVDVSATAFGASRVSGPSEKAEKAMKQRPVDEGEIAMTEADTTELDTDAESASGANGVSPEDDALDALDAEGGQGDDLEERLVAEGEIAGDYLEELLDLLDFDGDIDLDVEGNRAVVSIDGSSDLNKLVGRTGEVLDALQELTRLAVHQKTGVRSRLMLDVASWRRRRREELAALGDQVARRVLENGDREQLAPMTPFERKIVHDAVAAVPGVHSESEGVEPSRRVVVLRD